MGCPITTEQEYQVMELAGMKPRESLARVLAVVEEWKAKRRRTFACCNPECDWTGKREDTVHLKHEPDHPLCPECYEVLEEIAP